MKYYAYFPGCSSAEGTAIAYGISTEAICAPLEIELLELDDWNCCGTTPYSSIDELASVAVAARNLALAEQTGLDLVMFNDIVFYELPISLYTLWQAMRRVWRLGQKKAVKCRFMVYNDTIEAALLERMGKKLKAAMLLYGDEAAGVIIEQDDTDLQREMIRDALEGKSYKNLEELNDGLVHGLFATGTEKEVVVTDSPMGSPIAQSVEMPLIQLEISFDGPAQLSMFGEPVPARSVKARRRR